MTNDFECDILQSNLGGRDMKKNKETLETMALKVKEILQKRPETRNNDRLLYCYYLNSTGVSVKKNSYWDIATQVDLGKIPSIESLGRTRRKVQELNPELGPTTQVRKMRYRAEEDFKAFSRKKEI